MISKSSRRRPPSALLRSVVPCLALLMGIASSGAGPYVTRASGIRWNDVGGVRWNDVGGIRWNDVGGIRWNDVGGLLFTDASGIRWNDVGGIRWNDVGALSFDDVGGVDGADIDLELLNLLTLLPNTSSVNVVITYDSAPTELDLSRLQALGVAGGILYRRLPMVAVNATPGQITAISELPGVRSVWADRTLSFFDAESRVQIGAEETEADPDLASASGAPLSGFGVTIAVIDSGVDASHPDLPLGTKVVGNVRLNPGVWAGPGFIPPTFVEGITDTDLVLGHGTFVASVAAGSGAASAGLHRGVAPGASILGVSTGDIYIIHVLEAFDYVLDQAGRFGVRIVNCSWGTQGFFDPDDPVNIATRLLHDAGLTVVFAAGNHGPAPDTLNPYAVAPWVIGAGSTDREGGLSAFSARGIFEEVLYHPTLLAPGEGIIGARAAGVSAIGGIVGVADVAAGVSLPPALTAHYTVASGTSFAAPHVAGVVALMLEADPSLTPAAIKRALQATATPILSHDRADTGAGRLDAWAAVSQAFDSTRPFGTHVPGWLDERPFLIEHRPSSPLELVVPAAGALQLPVFLSGPLLSYRAVLAWGTGPAPPDLDARLLDASGGERMRSEAYSGASLFGRAEGLAQLGPFPQRLTLEVFFKEGQPALVDQTIHLLQEVAVAEATYADLDEMAAADRHVVDLAVARRILIGRGSSFEPQATLTRGELARSLALVGGLPQRIPELSSFPDVQSQDPLFPYIESIAGGRATRLLMDSGTGASFNAGHAVDRLDFAIGLVRAAGLEAEASARSGETLGIVDEDKIPAANRGHVAIALERGWLATIPTGSGAKFDPKGSVPRLDAARSLLLLLAGSDGAPETTPSPRHPPVPGPVAAPTQPASRTLSH